MPEQPSNTPEGEPVTLEQVLDVLGDARARLAKFRVEGADEAKDPGGLNFKTALGVVLTLIDTRAGALSGPDATAYWVRRSMLFVEAGYRDADHVAEAVGYAEQFLVDAEADGDQEAVAQFERLIEGLRELEPTPEVPTVEQIAEALRQPGRLPREAHTAMLAWKTSQLEADPSRIVEVEMEAARLYADAGRKLDAFGSLVAALYQNPGVAALSPEARKPLEDYHRELDWRNQKR